MSRPDNTDDEPTIPDATDPAAVAARLMFRRAVGRHREALSHDGIAVVIEVGGKEWVDLVGEAWRELVRPADDMAPTDGDDFPDLKRWHRSMGRWLEIRRAGETSVQGPDVGNEPVALALNHGRSVIGISPEPARLLPRDLLSAADHTIVLPPLDSRLIRDLARQLKGQAPTRRLADRFCRLLGVGDLRLALRPGQGPDDYVTRLERLAKGKMRPARFRLSDLHGMAEATRWGKSLARDLRDYRRGRLSWNDIDRGAVLFGPPGTGKTTFAQVLAEECQVPLITGSFAEWQSLGHLGDMLRGMRNAFDKARKAAPCILFIDEVDAFADRSRSDHEYYVQVITALLGELDGVTGREGVVVVGACNHPQRLDPALRRPGRFERLIPVSLPNRKELARIFRHHLCQELAGCDLSGVARLALGCSGADVAAMVRAARRRARCAQRAMRVEDLLGELLPTQPPQERRRAAIHEAGHGVAFGLLHPCALMYCSIRPLGGDALGMTVVEAPRAITATEVRTRMCCWLAGRAAEEVLLGSASAGAGGDSSSDLAMATTLAVEAIARWGLDGSLLWQLGDEQDITLLLRSRPDVAERAAAQVQDAYQSAMMIARRFRPAIDKVSRLLLTNVVADGRSIVRIVETTAALPDAPQRPRTNSHRPSRVPGHNSEQTS